MYDNSPEAAVYCPVCGIVLYWDLDQKNELIIPDRFHNKKCIFCGHEMIRCEEPYENFCYDKSPPKNLAQLDARKLANDVYVLRNYVIDNPLFDEAQYIKRILERVDENAKAGYESSRELHELEIICGIKIEQPKIVERNKSWPIEVTTIENGEEITYLLWPDRPKTIKGTSESMNNQNINSSQISCPRCGSTSITTQKKGFGVGKAAAGVLAVGLAGALAGGIGANKAVNVCAKCGHKWSPGGR